MSSPFRVLAALFALVALSVYFAAGLWASMCLPEMEKVGHASAEQSAVACPMDATDATAEGTGSPEHPASESPVCPLGPLGMSGSCVAVSLPAATATIVLSCPEGSLLSPSPDAARDLLLAAALFHPPRA